MTPRGANVPAHRWREDCVPALEPVSRASGQLRGYLPDPSPPCCRLSVECCQTRSSTSGKGSGPLVWRTSRVFVLTTGSGSVVLARVAGAWFDPLAEERHAIRDDEIWCGSYVHRTSRIVLAHFFYLSGRRG